MEQHADVLVLGGGVIGLTAAYFLAREGLRVEVLDKGDFGQEASWAGAGILSPRNTACAKTPAEKLHAHSVALFPTLSAELRERTRVDNGYLRCGGLEFVGEDELADENEWRSEGIAFERIDETQRLRLEPAVAVGFGTAYHLPDMAQVRNPRHIKALTAGCQSYGVRLLPACEVRSVEVRQSRVASVQTENGPLTAERYLLTAGAWTDNLLAPTGWQPGIRPVRGQIALLNAGAPIFRRVLLWGSQYLVPRPDGRVLVGSTQEDAGFNKHTTAAAISDLLALACKLVPALAQVPVERCWAGLRPGTPDGLPYLGAVPGVENLFIAAGHFRSGIQLSPGTALVMKELLLGQPLTVPLDAFCLDRAATRR